MESNVEQHKKAMQKELLAHLTHSVNEASIRSLGLLAKQEHSIHGNVVHFHRLRPVGRGHTLNYLRRYARVSDLIVVTVDPELLDRSKLKLTREEAIYFGDIPPELLRIYK
jgi:hypothetical protein